jgi:hypothetical protein
MAIGMERRQFICAIGGAAFTWPLVARAEGLKETGFVQDQNVTIDFRWTEGQSD